MSGAPTLAKRIAAALSPPRLWAWCAVALVAGCVVAAVGAGLIVGAATSSGMIGSGASLVTLGASAAALSWRALPPPPGRG